MVQSLTPAVGGGEVAGIDFILGFGEWSCEDGARYGVVTQAFYLAGLVGGSSGCGTCWDSGQGGSEPNVKSFFFQSVNFVCEGSFWWQACL